MAARPLDEDGDRLLGIDWMVQWSRKSRGVGRVGLVDFIHMKLLICYSKYKESTRKLFMKLFVIQHANIAVTGQLSKVTCYVFRFVLQT